MKATREVETIVHVKVGLEGRDRFQLPAHTRAGMMTVHRVRWQVGLENTHSHPLTAWAIDDDGCHWTLSLRMSDVPEHVRTALTAACEPGDMKP